MKSVVIVQPYVPTYRVAFFEGLISDLRTHQIDCRVVAGDPDATQALRNDSASAHWLSHVEQLRFRAFGHSINIGSMPAPWRQADGVIVPLVGHSLETYRALFGGFTGHLKVGVWGHIKPYVTKGNPIDARAELWQMRRADHIFAYTAGGASFAVENGIFPSAVTAVMNTIDTVKLSQTVESITQRQSREFNAKYSLIYGRTLAFVGGLDESKRISFLAESLDLLWESAPDVKVLIGGSGAQEHLLAEATARGQVVMLGYVDATTKALMGAVSSALLMPGRIGLVAVEALLLGLPVLSTTWPYHAPEAEYLEEGVSIHSTANSPHAYAQGIENFLSGTQDAESKTWDYPRLADMITNFSAGVRAMLASDRER